MGERTWDCEPPILGESLKRAFFFAKGLGGPLPLKPRQTLPGREASRSPSQRSRSSRRYCGGLNA
jgi:hypothetical protein